MPFKNTKSRKSHNKLNGEPVETEGSKDNVWATDFWILATLALEE